MLRLILCCWASVLLVVTSNAQAQDSAPTPNATTPNATTPTAPIVVAPPTAQDLLNKMSHVAGNINYRGAFTYQNQSVVTQQSFKIEHWIQNGQEHDRLMFLNGPEREILREGQAVDCVTMGDKLLQGGFTQVGKKLANLNNLYQFEVRSQERVAGRLARMLLVIPKDLYRYGYFLSIDEETGLVLKSWLIDEKARPLERYQFVSVDVDLELSQFEQSKASSHQHKALANVTPCNPTVLSKPEMWQVAWVPQGFAFAGQRMLANGQNMLMYTDGLATFSIFLEPTTSFVPESIGQRGATLAYMSSLNYKNSIYRVSVVGEIPVAAAAKITQNIAGL